MRTLALLVSLTAAAATAQDAGKSRPAENSTPEGAAADYVDALYQVKPELIARSVSKSLAKRGYSKGRSQDYQEHPMTYAQLHELAAGWGKGKSFDDAPREIELLGKGDRIAEVLLTAQWGIDLMQVHKRDDGHWEIAHVIWQAKRPAAADKAARKAIEKACLGYIDAFYQAKPELIDETVSEDLAKFGYYRQPDGEQRLMPMSFEFARNFTKQAFPTPPKDAPREVEVLHATDQIAAVRIVAEWGVDFAHLAKLDGEWKLTHVIWESHSPKADRDQPLKVADAINAACPFSGEAIRADSLTEYAGKVVGFCNPNCRDKFAREPQKYAHLIKGLR